MSSILQKILHELDLMWEEEIEIHPIERKEHEIWDYLKKIDYFSRLNGKFNYLDISPQDFIY